MSATIPKTVDIATEADWNFVQVPEVYERLQSIVRRVAREKEVGAEDLEQDLMLHIAVRPQLTNRNWCDEDQVNQFLAKALLECRTIAKASIANRWRLDYIEDSSSEDEQWP